MVYLCNCNCGSHGFYFTTKQITMPKKAKKERAVEQYDKSDFKALFYRKLTETHLFFEVGRTIASELEPLELVRKIVASIGKAISFENASVYLVKKDLTGLEPFYTSGPLFMDVTPEPLFLDNGAPGMIAATGEPLFIGDATSFESFMHYPDEPAASGSYMGIALKTDARVIAVMGFSHSDTDAFRVEEFDLLRTLSHLISAGLEKAELFKKTLELARVDELTGLYNYRVLLEKLEEEVRRQVRNGKEFAFVMIDIDDFKRINDRYGHLEGSRLIAQMGALLKAAVRTDSTDTCFRYGGEEFSILLAEATSQEGEVVAERVRKSIEDYPFTVKVAHPLEPVTVSMGVSSLGAKSGKPLSTLISEADVALYRAKAAGKNRVFRFTEGNIMPEKPVERP